MPFVHAADIQDRDGGAFVMATMFGLTARSKESIGPMSKCSALHTFALVMGHSGIEGQKFGARFDAHLPFDAPRA